MKNLEIDNIASHQLHDSLLLFRSAEQIFAVPALAVQEILYPLPVTPLPFVSHAIEGLINVEGRIAVQLCLAKLNHLPAPSAHPELVLLDTGRARCALHVDAVISREPFDNINPAPDLDPGNPFARIISGSVIWHDAVVHVLSPAAIGKLIQPEAAQETGEGLIGSALSYAEDDTHKGKQHLLMQTGGERYALPLTHVVEILEAAPCITLPGASSDVDGLFLLREQVLLVVDLATHLQVPRTRPAHGGWFVVLEHAEGRCAFGVDEIIGIEHMNEAYFQTASDASRHIAGVFALPTGNILLLSSHQLIDEQLATQLARHHRDTRQQQEITEANLRFLEVLIADTPYAIPATTVKRIMAGFPAEPVQDSSGRIRGAINLNGHIIPVLALAHGLSLSRAVSDREYVIVGDDDTDWAIGVDAVQRIVNVPVSQVNHLRRQDARYIDGVARIEGKLVSTLDFCQRAEHASPEASE